MKHVGVVTKAGGRRTEACDCFVADAIIRGACLSLVLLLLAGCSGNQAQQAGAAHAGTPPARTAVSQRTAALHRTAISNKAAPTHRTLISRRTGNAFQGGSGPMLTGTAALEGWKSEAPGVRHLITTADLPPPYATPSARNFAHVIRRPANAWPKAPPGFHVTIFASGLDQPRKIITAPNGDIFVAESAAGRIHLFRDSKDRGKPDVSRIFASGLNKPFGMAFYPPGPNPRYLYVANTGSVVRYPYRNGDLHARSQASTIVSDIPGGGHLPGGGHWTRDLVFSQDGKRMFVSVGSHSNDWEGERGSEYHRADILEFTPGGTFERVYASGIRNPVGLAINPVTGALWTSVNERDGLGDNLVPDYITHVQPGGFYGWPWFYIGAHWDPRHRGQHPELRNRVIVPDVLLESHMASLCMTFYAGRQFPASYYLDAFAAEHGSWNRSRRVGYEVIYVPMLNGKSTGDYVDFMTGFVTPSGEVWGRPVGVTVARDGALLVTDDGSGKVWRVAYK